MVIRILTRFSSLRLSSQIVGQIFRDPNKLYFSETKKYFFGYIEATELARGGSLFEKDFFSSQLIMNKPGTA